MQVAHDKKGLILQAAGQLFHRWGYSKTSLDDIAKEAGMGKGTIYYYFESKEDIFLAVIEQHSEEYFTALQEMIYIENNWEEKFTRAITLPVKLVYEHTPILLDAIKNFPRNYLLKLGEFRDRNREQMVSLLESIIEDGCKQGLLRQDLQPRKLAELLHDWVLFGNKNIMICNPEEFVKQAETDYRAIVHVVLHGILNKG